MVENQNSALRDRDERIADMKDWIMRMANAPDTQVSAFVRSACIAFLDHGTGDLPPGDPLKRIAELEANLRDAQEMIKWMKSPAESCKEERDMGNGGCGACSICCKELRKRAEKAEAHCQKLDAKRLKQQHRACDAENRAEKAESELAWYRTLKIVRHEGNITEIDGGEKAQMLHEMWEENVRLKEELSEHGLSHKETTDLLGGESMNVAQQGAELLRRGKRIEELETKRDNLREACEASVKLIKSLGHPDDQVVQAILDKATVALGHD